MPESTTPLLDYYPEGWTETITDPGHVEWQFDADETIAVRLTVEESPPQYYVRALTGVTVDGEGYVATEVAGLGTAEAFEVAQSLVYAMHGAIGRLEGDDEFCGDCEG